MTTPTPNPTDRTRCLIAALVLVSVPGGISISIYLEGIAFWLALAVSVGCLCYFVRLVLRHRRSGRVAAWDNISVALLTTMLALTLAEGGIIVSERFAASRAAADHASLTGPLLVPGALTASATSAMQERLGVMTLPDEWRRERVPGTERDYVWHKALHEMDDHYQSDHRFFRRKTPFPARQPGIFRIVVVGDSLTYGAGIAKQHTYPEILQRLLNAQFNLEILNLGVSGHQSTDVLNTLEAFIPELQPDLVIYGICLNDFLPSGQGEYAGDHYAFPLPDTIKQYLINRSRLASLVADRYDQLLIMMGLRFDFMDDILKDFDGYQKRFAADLQKMSDLVTGEHQTPMLAMVLHQIINIDGRGHQATKIAEQHVQATDIELIESQPYFDAYDGRTLFVSKWEGHPNELANAMFASMLYTPTLRKLSELEHSR